MHDIFVGIPFLSPSAVRSLPVFYLSAVRPLPFLNPSAVRLKLVQFDHTPYNVYRYRCAVMTHIILIYYFMIVFVSNVSLVPQNNVQCTGTRVVYALVNT